MARKSPGGKQNSVAKYIARYMVPIYTVEKPEFINMLKVLNPRYVLQSRKYFAEVALPVQQYSWKDH